MKIEIALAALCALMPVTADATTYNLESDFSNVSNPNGVWSFTIGSTPLTHFSQPTDGDSTNAAAENGFWGVESTFRVPSTVVRVTQNGSVTGAYNDEDFLSGDVIAHARNSSQNGNLLINWTAPSAGILDLSSAVWYAHSPVTRSDDISVILGSTVLGTVTVGNGITRSNPITSLSATGLTVEAGDVLSFVIARSPTSPDSAGAFVGISETINFTPSAVPEPAAWSLLIGGFGMVGGVMRRRSRVSVRFA